MEKLQQNINAQFDANNAGLLWAKSHLKGISLSGVKRDLLQNKITLSYIGNASQVKPGIALFGASQVGKSYLSNYLLATDSHPLYVYDNTGNSVGFLNTIDPNGNGKEATAFVTRFSLDSTCGPNPNYPYRVKLLRPIEIIMILVDGYFNDIKGQIVSTKEEIEEEKKRLFSKYSTASNSNVIISAEDICELRNYFTTRYLSQRPDFCENLERCNYFATLDTIADKLTATNLTDVFGFLWGYNPIIDEVLNSVVEVYEKIKFSTEVHVSLDALKREDGTILHVDRIYEFVGREKLSIGMQNKFEPAKVKEMSVLLGDGTIAFNIKKSHFCMIAKEVAFSVVNNEDQAQIAEMEKAKPFLKKMDILDFPGARSRKEILASGFNYDGLVIMLVRGKVAFLFNKYSHQYLISSLIFCQDESQDNITSLPRLIDGWVRDNIGANIAERSQLMKMTKGISPLIMVATKFNRYLQQANKLTISDSTRRKEEMMNIWVRMASALSGAAVIAGSTDSWFDNWTNDSPFKVIFPLRGYKFSTELYEGYTEIDDKITGDEEKMTHHFAEIYNDLKKTFVDTRSEFIQLHINDAEYLWNEVTGVNADGSKPILEYLETVAAEINSMRKDMFARLLQGTFKQFIVTLLKYYHDDNAIAELEKQRKAASRIRLSMNILFGKDKDFFSDFINKLTIDEANLHDVVLDTINAIEIVEETDNDALFAIRESADIDFNDSYDANLQRLMSEIACDTIEELETELGNYGLTVEKVISPYKVKNLSIMIAEAIETKWRETNLNPETYATFVSRGMKESQLISILDNMGALFSKKVYVTEKMAERIHPHILGASSLDDLADMIADICAHMINVFISSMGATYYTKEDWESLKQTKEQLNLPISLHYEDFVKASFEEGNPNEEKKKSNCIKVSFNSEEIKNSLPNLFNAFDIADIKATHKQVRPTSYMSNWIEFQQWIDLMETSFIATIGIPTYNVEMNDALRNIIQKYILDAPALRKNAESDKNLTSLVTLKISES